MTDGDGSIDQIVYFQGFQHGLDQGVLQRRLDTSLQADSQRLKVNDLVAGSILSIQPVYRYNVAINMYVVKGE